MSNFNQVDIVDLAEAYATLNGMDFDSEESVSELFDQDIKPAVVAKYGKDDETAILEAFNNWTDELRENGELHESQYDTYTYVGSIG